MDRKEFLIIIWRKGIKPILLAIAVYFCARFIYQDLTEGGILRFLTTILMGLGLLMLVASLFGVLFFSFTQKLNSLLPESVKLRIGVIRKFINRIFPIILGIMMYHFWVADWLATATVLGVLLIQKVVELIEEKKQTSTR